MIRGGPNKIYRIVAFMSTWVPRLSYKGHGGNRDRPDARRLQDGRGDCNCGKDNGLSVAYLTW